MVCARELLYRMLLRVICLENKGKGIETMPPERASFLTTIYHNARPGFSSPPSPRQVSWFESSQGGQGLSVTFSRSPFAGKNGCVEVRRRVEEGKLASSRVSITKW